MNFELLFTTAAQKDIDEIFIWYEEQQPGLGFKFIEGLEDITKKIKLNPYFAFNIEEDARSTALKNFPMKLFTGSMKAGCM